MSTVDRFNEFLKLTLHDPMIDPLRNREYTLLEYLTDDNILSEATRTDIWKEIIDIGNLIKAIQGARAEGWKLADQT